MLDSCGPAREYEATPKTLADLRRLFEEVHITHHGKEEKNMATAVGWPLLWVVQLAIDTQLEAGARVRKRDKLKLEKDIYSSASSGTSWSRWHGGKVF